MNARTVRVLLRSLCIATLVAVSPLGMGGAWGDPTPEDGAAYSSVIVDLKDAQDDFEAVMEELTSVRQNRLRERFRGELNEVLEVKDRLQKDPGSLALQAELEDHLSNAIVVFTSSLSEFVEMEPEVMQRFDGFAASVKEVYAAQDHIAEEARTEVAGFLAVADSSARQLDRLAESYRPLLASERELNPKVNSLVVKLEALQQSQRMKAAVAEHRYQQALRASSTLEGNIENLRRLRTELEAEFIKARAHYSVLGDLAQMRKESVEIAQLQLTQQTIHDFLETRLPSLDDKEFESLVKGSLFEGSEAGGEFSGPLVTQSGREILLRHLTPAETQGPGEEVALSGEGDRP